MLSITPTPRPCPVCGPGAPSRLFAESRVDLAALDGFAFASRKLPENMHWRLAECQACDLLYADPAPTPEDLAPLYRDAAFDSSDEARMAARTYGRILERFVDRLPDRVGAVDVGTGDGVFLKELLGLGFRDVVGIEPSSAPIAAAEPEVRGLIRHDVFRAGSLPDGSNSLIACFQTIEHLSDPLTFCRDAFRALKPGGAIFLIGHDRRALSAKILGRKSPIFDIEHLQLFSKASLRRLLEAAGFGDVRVTTFLNRYPLRYWARLLPFPKAIKPRVVSLLASNGLGRLALPMPAGNVAAIGFVPDQAK